MHDRHDTSLYKENKIAVMLCIIFFAWTTTTDARIVGHVYKNWMNFGGKNRKYNWSFCESSSSATLFSVMWSRPFVYGTLLFGEENPNHVFWIMGCA